MHTSVLNFLYKSVVKSKSLCQIKNSSNVYNLKALHFNICLVICNRKHSFIYLHGIGLNSAFIIYPCQSSYRIRNAEMMVLNLLW